MLEARSQIKEKLWESYCLAVSLLDAEHLIWIASVVSTNQMLCQISESLIMLASQMLVTQRLPY